MRNMHDRALEGTAVDRRIILKWALKQYCDKTQAAHDWDTSRHFSEDDSFENLLTN